MRQSTLKLLVKLTSLKHSIHFLYHFTILGWSQHEHSWWCILWCIKHVSDRSHNSYTNKYIYIALFQCNTSIYKRKRAHPEERNCSRKCVPIVQGCVGLLFNLFFLVLGTVPDVFAEMQSLIDLMQVKLIFTRKVFHLLNLGLKMRVFGTQKWSILMFC